MKTINAALWAACLCAPLSAQPSTPADADADCLLQQLTQAGDTTTASEIRAACAQAAQAPRPPINDDPRASAEPGPREGPLSARLAREQASRKPPFTIMAHEPNWLLAASWNRAGYDPTIFRDALDDPDYQLDDTETQFQISIKTPIGLDLFDSGVDAWLGYTVRTFWQLYNTKESEPFRDTNHSPQGWLQMQPSWQIGNFKIPMLRLGMIHQSNGREQPYSRSWNRLFAEAAIEQGPLVLSMRPWIRFAGDTADRDNPDIGDYFGHVEFNAAWAGEKSLISMMLRNNLESGFSRGAVEAGWSYPIPQWPWARAYLQYFYGYGESLLDYNQRTHRIGLGLALTDWF
ncbi:phospholipase A [Gammaproteobacteria bacterium]|nr:phospholipase A [Gammaproteobacteria bacterium]